MAFDKTRFGGVVAPIVNPCGEDDSLDRGALEANLTRLLATDVAGLYINGGTGDAANLTQDERLETAALLVPRLLAAGKLAIVHVGQTNQRQAVELARQAAALGAHAVASIPPKKPWPQIVEYYKALAAAAAPLQQRIDAGELTYNEAWREAYAAEGPRGHEAEAFPHPGISTAAQRADQGLPLREDAESAAPKELSWDDLFALHRANETAPKRVVGLVVETRPDLVTADACRSLRALGCTKVQIGIQSLSDDLLAANGRAITSARIADAMALLRRYGFKSHVHFMVNLLGADPASDIADYRRLVTDPAFLPDEVKLYPCCLVESAQLTDCYEAGRWRPYTEEELVGVLVADVLATPPWTRISRMIRDISATDILVGNKKTNLRQVVEAAVDATGEPVAEIRSREISVEGATVCDLSLQTIAYQTATTEERFLEWITPENKIAGFCRLSLPTPLPRDTANEPSPPLIQSEQSEARGSSLASPSAPQEAMIREVHVYGKVAALHRTGEGTQHLGLGRALVEEACAQAAAAGYTAINVISAVGTRVYYRNLGFKDAGLYQKRPLP